MNPNEPFVHAHVGTDPIDVHALLQLVGDHAAGATAVFVGTVRRVHDGRAVSGIDYQAYVPMAARELTAIAREAARRFGACGIAIAHRIGYLTLGEASVAIATSHAQRGPAFDATRYAIEQIKQRVPIWKREHYGDGTREWVDPTRAASPPVLAGHDPTGPLGQVVAVAP